MTELEKIVVHKKNPTSSENLSTIYFTEGRKVNKIATHWSTKISKKLKRNIVTNNFHRAEKICSEYNKARNPPKFIKCVIRSIHQTQNKPQTDNEQTVKSKSHLS